MDPILTAHFNRFLQQYGGPTVKPDVAKDFEKFANYVLLSREHPEIFSGDIERLDAVSVGGGADIGLDGVAIKLNDRLVTATAEIDDTVADSKQLAVHFTFIQSKHQTTFDSGEFLKFGNGVKLFFSPARVPENEKIGKMRELKDRLFQNDDVSYKLRGLPSVSLYYVNTGSEPDDEHVVGLITQLKDELERLDVFDSVEVALVGGKRLVRYCRELENKFDALMVVDDIVPLSVNPETGVKKAYTFTCSAPEFLKVLVDEDGRLRRSLFNDNVRDYLGNKGSINSEIENTIKQSPELFVLCNNGITIVCSDFEQLHGRQVRLSNPQIVNGCQTSNSIFHLRAHENTKKLQLIVRLIATENIDVSNEIVRGTNKQNQVLEEAFEATQIFHKDVLEPYFSALVAKPRLVYERRAKQYAQDLKISRNNVVNLRILTQAFVATFLRAPHEAIRHEAKLLSLYANDAEPRRLFAVDHDPLAYYTAARIWHAFEELRRDQQLSTRDATFIKHLYFAYAHLAGFPPQTCTKSRALEAYCNKLNARLETSFADDVGRVSRVLDEASSRWTAKGRSHFAMKDNREFTDVLAEVCRDRLLPASGLSPVGVAPVDSVEMAQSLHGQVLKVHWKDENGGVRWFGFISCASVDKNIYFNATNYAGDVALLRPKIPVKFDLVEANQGYVAANVSLDEAKP